MKKISMGLRACAAALIALPCTPVVHAGSAAYARAAQPTALSLTLSALTSGKHVLVGKGQQPTLLAVFATWCRSCKDDVTTFNTLHRELESAGVRVIALNADEGSDERVSRWLAVYKATYPVVRDTSGVAFRSIGVVGVPEVHLIDSNGRIIWSRRGPVESHLAELRAAVAKVAVHATPAGK